MSITNNHLLLERPNRIGGRQRIYRFQNGYGLSVVDSAYPFAWEIAVLKGVDEKGNFESLCYDTSLTDDVEVFGSDEGANDFIERAAREIGGAA